MEPNKSLVVRQSLLLNLLVAVIFLSIFVGVIFTIRGQSSFSTPDYIKYAACFLVPGLGAIYAGKRHTEVFRITDTGIFYYKKLVTSWDRFIQAYAEEVDPEKGYSVNFSLCIEYYDIDTGVTELIKFPLSATLDKSVEQIQAAIDSFSSGK